MGSIALEDRGRQANAEALTARLAVEPDETTRQVLAVGLLQGDPGRGGVDGDAARARAGGRAPTRPWRRFALARRAGEELAAKVDALLASRDPVMRAHVARGLAASQVAGRRGSAGARVHVGGRQPRCGGR
jgi:hypothetical protein